jgi:DNA-binding SARP family transcriptional activator/tetratricopeptide (TPR) repeat protein
VEFHILGPLRVRNEGKIEELGGRPGTLLAALLSNPNRAVSTGRLAQELYGEDAPAAPNTVHVNVSRLRKLVGHERIEKDPAGYRLRVEQGELDAEHFARAAEDGKQAMAAGAPERAARLLRQALAMWKGEHPFAGLDLGPLAQAETDRVVENRRAARDACFAAELDAGRHESVVGELRGALDLDPTDEALAVPLMVALYRCDRQDDALQVYRRVSRALAELGLTPGPALRETEKRIFDHDPRLKFSQPAAAAGGLTPLPPVLAALPVERVPIVGRDAELAQLRRIVGEVEAGARRVVLIDGAAGIGKTRLAADVALEAHAAGFAVGWGASAEGLSAPYGVWHDALSHLVRHMTEERLAEHVRAYGNTISYLIPWFDQASPPSFEPQSSTAATMLSTPREEPHLLFAAVAGLLRTLCADRPVALVLDDIHWANQQSLRLLRYVAAETPDVPLLALAICRDRETPESYPVRALHADLKRLPDAERLEDLGVGGPVLSLELRPLSRPQVHEFITEVAGHDTGPGGHELADALFDETAGTPFLVREVLRHLRSRGAVQEDPDGRWRLLRPITDDDLPHDVVTHCVEELGPDAHAILSAASVIGSSFDARLLGRLVELSTERVANEERVAKALATASRGRVLTELETPPKHYTFEHACFQHSLYAQIPSDESSLRHVAVALALEETGRGDPLERAHHWVTADHPEYADQAVHYARRAGERALEQLAADEAVRWFEAARDRVGDDEAERCDILTRLGVAERQLGGDFGATLTQACEIAEALDDHRRLARAVIANSAGPFGAAGHANEERVDWLERALAELADDPEAPLIRAVLGKELYYGGEPEAGAEQCRQALEEACARYDAIAADAPDPAQVPAYAKRELAGVLAYATAIDPITPPDRDAALEHAELFAELADLAEQLDDPELRFKVASGRFIRGMHVGDPDELDRGLETMEEVAPSGPPILRWMALWSASARRLVAGDLDGAEEMADEAAAFGRSRHVENQDVVEFGQRMGIAAERGTLDELAEWAERIAREHPYLPLVQLARPYIDARAGRRDAAGDCFEEIVKGGYRFDYPQTRAACFARCADIALQLGDRARYQELYQELLAFRDQFATPSGVSTHGSVRLSLARLARALGDDEAATEHLAAAEHAHDDLGAPLLRARTYLLQGEALLEREPERAAERLARAHKLARDHDGRVTMAAAEKLLERATELGCGRPSSALLS